MKAKLDEIEKVCAVVHQSNGASSSRLFPAIRPVFSTSFKIGVRGSGSIVSPLRTSQTGEVEVIRDQFHVIFLSLKAAQEEQQEVK